VSYSVLQFGNINGDKFPDMVTYGYRAQAAGNPYGYAGSGDHFDWAYNPLFGDLPASYGTRMLDLDGDGDLDMLSNSGVFRNDSGKFVRVSGYGMATPHNDDKARADLAGLVDEGSLGWEAFDLFACDISSDTFPDIIFLGDREMILGISRAKLDWEFFLFEKLSPPSFDANEGGRLVFLKPPSPDLESFLKAGSVRYRVPSAPPPKLEKETPTGQNRDEYHWLDLDGDGTVELTICHSQMCWETRKGRIDIYREHSDRFELLSSLSTEPYPARDRPTRLLARPPFPLYQFVDFDKDGRLDLLCQDRWIYRQGDSFVFTKARKIELSEKGLFPATLYAFDVNADGWPDVVSSYQPFWNIALGPLLK
jgi:ribosomal protein S30